MQCFGHESMATKIRCPRRFRACRVTILIFGIRLSIGITVTCSDLAWPELSVVFLLMKPQYLFNDFQSRTISERNDNSNNSKICNSVLRIQSPISSNYTNYPTSWLELSRRLGILTSLVERDLSFV